MQICINMQNIWLLLWFALETWLIKNKILQSDWLRTFWPISQEQKFPRIWDLCRNTANNINFHYWKNSVEVNDQIFQLIQRTLFCAHFLVHFYKSWENFSPQKIWIMFWKENILITKSQVLYLRFTENASKIDISLIFFINFKNFFFHITYIRIFNIFRMEKYYISRNPAHSYRQISGLASNSNAKMNQYR